MTAKEFANNNSDIVLERLTLEEFQELTDGDVVFCVAVSRGSKPSEERKVLNVGYHLVANTYGSNGKTSEIITLCVTTNGVAKVDCINVLAASDEGTRILYKCKSLPHGDPRTGGKWNYK